ncbi:MAG TPA: N-acetyltransferase [Gammaproteobacteria bacterium]|nr:N-acetyltransferase [Gammaproteobacteria bacterium]
MRPALLSDINALAALELNFPSDRLSARSFRHLLTRGHAEVLVSQQGADITGNIVVLYRRNCTHARLYSLVVHPQHQQRGIARTLLNAAEQAAGNKNCTTIGLEVRPDNEAALRLYQKMGYSVTVRIPAFYEDGAPALRLRKNIAS